MVKLRLKRQRKYLRQVDSEPPRSRWAGIPTMGRPVSHGRLHSLLLVARRDNERLLGTLKRLRDQRDAGLARLSAGPDDSEQASLVAAAAAARLRLASGPPEAVSKSEPIGLPSVPDACASRHVGIHALEIYTPRHVIDAAELEAAHDVPGKYTEGLMMREWSACDEDEDVVTMALTAVRRLVERCGVRWEDIGMLQVGSA